MPCYKRILVAFLSIVLSFAIIIPTAAANQNKRKRVKFQDLPRDTVNLILNNSLSTKTADTKHVNFKGKHSQLPPSRWGPTSEMLNQLSSTSKSLNELTKALYKQRTLTELAKYPIYNSTYNNLISIDEDEVNWRGVYNCLWRPNSRIVLKDVWNAYGAAIQPVTSDNHSRSITLLVDLDIVNKTITHPTFTEERKQRTKFITQQILKQTPQGLLDAIRRSYISFYPARGDLYKRSDADIALMIYRVYNYFGERVYEVYEKNLSGLVKLLRKLDILGLSDPYFAPTHLKQQSRPYYFAAECLRTLLQLLHTTETFEAADIFLRKHIMHDYVSLLSMSLSPNPYDQLNVTIYERNQLLLVRSRQHHYWEDIRLLPFPTRLLIKLESHALTGTDEYYRIHSDIQAYHRQHQQWYSMTGSLPSVIRPANAQLLVPATNNAPLTSGVNQIRNGDSIETVLGNTLRGNGFDLVFQSGMLGDSMSLEVSNGWMFVENAKTGGKQWVRLQNVQELDNCVKLYSNFHHSH